MIADIRRKAARQELGQRAKEAIITNAVELIAGPAHLKNLDRWIEKQNDPALDRIEAIRRLMEMRLGRSAENAA